jgi:hypothetical protein
MNKDPSGYAVFFFPPALEALGDAIKPYLQDGPAGPHVTCREVDTAGAFTELTLEGRTPEGRDLALELMVPSNMVRMIVSARADSAFGFHDRRRVTAAMIEPGVPLLAAVPPVPEPAVPEPVVPEPVVPEPRSSEADPATSSPGGEATTSATADAAVSVAAPVGDARPS